MGASERVSRLGLRTPPTRSGGAWAQRLAPSGFEITLFNHPERERVAPWVTLWEGRYGPKHWLVSPSLSWSADSCEALEAVTWVRSVGMPAASFGEREGLTLATLSRFSHYGAESEESMRDAWYGLLLHPARGAPWLEVPGAHGTAHSPCPLWKRRRAAVIARYNGEYERMALLECDGSVSSDTIDRLSVLARPAQRERPSLPLPLEPEADSTEHEWLPQLKLVHPRLAWLLQRITDAFPGRVVDLMSGYRPDSSPQSLHRQGRALDISVRGVPNEALFRFCRSLPHVGCGYYPNNHFVHVDVRPPTSAEAFWVDVSGPGEPSRYVDSWPGVVEGGALHWAGAD